MRATQSRRQLLSLTPAAGNAATTMPADNTSLQPVRAYQVSLAAAGGGLKVRLTAGVMNQVFDIDLENAEARDHFMKLLELALAGRGRMSLEVESDSKTVRSFLFDVP
jgi:hypothetical protein